MQARYLLTLKTLIQSPMVRQLVFMFGIAASVTLGIVVYMSIQEPTYRPLDYQVTPQNMAAIVDALEKAGIKYKMNEQDGLIMIPAKDMQLAHLKLSAGGIPRDDSFSFAFLNDQNAIGNSQFLENARYIRALESDLSKTISAIEGVSSARVHIAIPQNNVFADENGRPTASVVLAISPGLSSDKEKIRAIIQIVSGSVPGLDPKDVAITDQYGHYLSSAMDQNSIYNAEQLNYQNNIQSYYEKRIESMIIPMLGENKASVRIYANLDFTQQEEAKEQYDPDKKVLRSEQSMNEQSGAGGASGAPGSLSNTPPSSDAEKPASAQGNSTDRNESTKNYEVGKSVSYKKSNFAKVTSLSAAVILDNETVVDPKTGKTSSKPLDQDKITKITELVKATIGYDEARGDKVTVINSSFNVAKKEDVAALKPWDEPWFWDTIKKTLGMLLGFGFLFVLYRRMSAYVKKVNADAAPNKNTIMIEDRSEDSLSPQMLELKNEQINRLRELANREPARVASVIKNWVGK